MPMYEESIYYYECDGCGDTESDSYDDGPPDGWIYDAATDVVTCEMCNTEGTVDDVIEEGS